MLHEIPVKNINLNIYQLKDKNFYITEPLFEEQNFEMKTRQSILHIHRERFCSNY